MIVNNLYKIELVQKYKQIQETGGSASSIGRIQLLTLKIDANSVPTCFKFTYLLNKYSFGNVLRSDFNNSELHFTHEGVCKQIKL